ncbi:MAG: hypothetical protein HYV60_12375 [Planctomycetia bacterium]|nr:hypothetical protein [Planctomycetia bacterium]
MADGMIAAGKATTHMIEWSISINGDTPQAFRAKDKPAYQHSLLEYFKKANVSPQDSVQIELQGKLIEAFLAARGYRWKVHEGKGEDIIDFDSFARRVRERELGDDARVLWLDRPFSVAQLRTWIEGLCETQQHSKHKINEPEPSEREETPPNPAIDSTVEASTLPASGSLPPPAPHQSSPAQLTLTLPDAGSNPPARHEGGDVANSPPDVQPELQTPDSDTTANATATSISDAGLPTADSLASSSPSQQPEESAADPKPAGKEDATTADPTPSPVPPATLPEKTPAVAAPASPHYYRLLVLNLVLTVMLVLAASTISWLAWKQQRQAAQADQRREEMARKQLDGLMPQINESIGELERRLEAALKAAEVTNASASDKIKTSIDQLGENDATRQLSSDLAVLKSDLVALKNNLQGGLSELNALKPQITESNQSLSALKPPVQELLKLSQARTATPQQIAQALAKGQEFTALVERQKVVETSLLRLLSTLQFPAVNELPPILLIIDGGQRLEVYSPESLQKALLQTIEESLRLTSGRELGVIWNRDDLQTQIVEFKSHYASDWPQIELRLRNELQPAPGGEASATSGLKYALNRFVTRDSQQRKRLIYVTYEKTSVNGDQETGWTELVAESRKSKVELWMLQLFRGTDTPDAQLAQAAAATDGQFVAVSSQGSEATVQRLTEFFRQAFGLPAVLPSWEKK